MNTHLIKEGALDLLVDGQWARHVVSLHQHTVRFKQQQNNKKNSKKNKKNRSKKDNVITLDLERVTTVAQEDFDIDSVVRYGLQIRHGNNNNNEGDDGDDEDVYKMVVALGGSKKERDEWVECLWEAIMKHREEQEASDEQEEEGYVVLPTNNENVDQDNVSPVAGGNDSNDGEQRSITQEYSVIEEYNDEESDADEEAASETLDEENEQSSQERTVNNISDTESSDNISIAADDAHVDDDEMVELYQSEEDMDDITQIETHYHAKQPKDRRLAALLRIFDFEQEDEQERREFETLNASFAERMRYNAKDNDDDDEEEEEEETDSHLLSLVMEDERYRHLTKMQGPESPPVQDHCNVIEKVAGINITMKKDDDMGVRWSDVVTVEIPTVEGNEHVSNETRLMILVAAHRALYFINPTSMSLGEDDMRVSYKDISKILHSGYDPEIMSLLLGPDSAHDLVLHLDNHEQETLAMDLLPVSSDHQRTANQRKLEFFDHVSDAFFSCCGRQLPILCVDNVFKYTRRTPLDTFKPEPELLDPQDMLTFNEEYDHVKVSDHVHTVRSITAFGDRHILLSCLIHIHSGKSARREQYLVITDSALYFYANLETEECKRRIDIEEVQHVFRAPNDRKQLLLQIPNEHDVVFNTSHALQVEEVLSTLSNKEDFAVTLNQPDADLLTMAKSRKSDRYLMRMSRMDSLDGVLRHVATKDLKKITNHKLFRGIAKRITQSDDGNSRKSQSATAGDSDLRMASTALGQTKEQELMKERLRAAIETKDILTISEVEQFITKPRSNVKVNRLLSDFLEQMKPDIDKIYAEKCALKRIDHLIHLPRDQRDTQKIQTAFQSALRKGLKVDHYRREYDRIVQRDFAREEIGSCVERHDASKLLLLLESAERLGIVDEPAFMRAREHVPQFLEETHVKREIMDAIRRSRGEMRDDAIKQVFRKYTPDERKNNVFSWLHNDEIYRRAKEECEKIGERRQIVDLVKSLSKEITNDILNASETETKKKKKETKEALQDDQSIEIVRKLGKMLARVEEDEFVVIDSTVASRAHQVLHLAESHVEAIHTKRANLLDQDLQLAMKDTDMERVKALMQTAKSQFKDMTQDVDFEHTANVHPLLVATAHRAQELLDAHERKRELRGKVAAMLQESTQAAFNLKDLDQWERVIDQAYAYDDLAHLLEKLNPFMTRVREQNELRQVLNAAVEHMDEILVKSCLEKAKNMPLLKDNVDRITHIFAMRKQQEAILRVRFKDAIRKMDNAALESLVEQASGFKDLDPLVQQAKRKLAGASGNEKTEEQNQAIRQEFGNLLELQDLERLGSFLGKYEDVLPSALLKQGKTELNRLRREETLNEQPIQQQQEEEEEEQQHQQQQLKDPIIEAKTTKHFRESHPLIEKLHKDVTNLMRVCSGDGLDDQSGRFIVTSSNPIGQSVMRTLTLIFYDGTRKRFFGRDRLPLEIFSKIPQDRTGSVRSHIEAFFVLDTVKEVQNNPQNQRNDKLLLSHLLIHYLLSIDQLQHFLYLLFNNDAYMHECYESNALVRSSRFGDDLYSVLVLIRQFKFDFFAPWTSNALASHPRNKVKTAVKEIIQFFIRRRSEVTTSAMLTSLGNDAHTPEMSNLVRVKLCGVILEFFSHNFKNQTLESRLFGQSYATHVWHLIEDMANQKRVSAIDIGGVGLPLAVDTINSMYSDRDDTNPYMDLRTLHILQDMDASHVNNIKFQAFICYALNEGALSSFVDSMLRESQVLNKFYRNSSETLVFQPDTVCSLVQYLSKLSPLPFKLRLVWLDGAPRTSRWKIRQLHQDLSAL